jgi:hypothetical protein
MAKTATAQDPMKIRLKGVRLSFPALFKPKSVEEGQEPKYSAAFLLDNERDAGQIALIERTIERCKKEKWLDKIPKGVKVCLHDGDEKEFEGYSEDNKFITSSSSRRPVVVDQKLEPLTESDGKPYAGCYVNCTLRLWAQDNKYGKRINAEIQAVQFFKDGDSFGAAPVNAEDEFEEVDGDEDGSDLFG